MYKSKNHSKLKAGDNSAHSWSKLKTCTFSEQRRYKLIEWDSPIRIQVVLRKGAESYIEFSHFREVDFNEG